MNGTPAVSWQRLCAIEKLKFKVTQSSVKKYGNPNTTKLDRFQNRKSSVEFRRVEDFDT